jgi:hypothetical protein
MGFPPVRDYSPLLEQAIAEAKAEGLVAEAAKLEDACFRTAYTTSSELLAEHGWAMRAFLKSTHGRLPGETKRKVKVCLNETELAWVGWRQLLAWLRRPETLR